ncbi:lipase/esterase [Rhizobium grahamii CCGE 502]|uniref:Lipase/esterase n=1 Tax=Rhizobium grahamii CCGE 502 TaxID=990285 RepID=S3HWA4_9HYPH|nr:lipase/esterase [Rhizobium grahamii CCGE 502]
MPSRRKPIPRAFGQSVRWRRKIIAKTEASYPADSNVASATDNRRYYDAMCAAFRQPRPTDISVIDTTVNHVPVRHYIPAHASEGRPSILYCHGGGFVVGSLESHDDVCAEIANSTGMHLTAVDYRLAPEHRYPAQIDDLETVWRHLAVKTPRLITVGDSAGANLCAALSLRMRRLSGPMPIAQLLIYPGLGGDHSWPSYIENAEAPLLRTSDLAGYRAAYSGSEQPSDQELEEVSPLEAKDFSGLPRTRVFTADVDPARRREGLCRSPESRRRRCRLAQPRATRARLSARPHHEPQNPRCIRGNLPRATRDGKGRFPHARLCRLGEARCEHAFFPTPSQCWHGPEKSGRWRPHSSGD